MFKKSLDAEKTQQDKLNSIQGAIACRLCFITRKPQFLNTLNHLNHLNNLNNLNNLSHLSHLNDLNHLNNLNHLNHLNNLNNLNPLNYQTIFPSLPIIIVKAILPY